MDIDWTDSTSDPDCNVAYTKFINIIKAGFQKCFPLKRLSIKRSKDQEWITMGLKTSSNTKNKLYREYLRQKTNTSEQRYKNYKNKFTTLCRAAETAYFNKLIGETKQSLRKLWSSFGPIINPQKRKKHTTIDKLIIDNKVTKGNKNICESFNEYFVNIGKKLAEKIPTNQNFKKYLGDRNHNSMFLSPTNVEEVLKELNKLSNKKSSGPEQIPVTIIKLCAPLLCNPLSVSVNKSFNSGTFPLELKVAKVIPIHKKKE